MQHRRGDCKFFLIFKTRSNLLEHFLNWTKQFETQILAQRCTNTFIRQRCGANSDCADTQKGPKCLCHKGYKWSDRTQSCKDIDECNSGSFLSPCKGNSKCHNTEGSFFCECPPGLTGEYCHRDIDECAEGTQVRFLKTISIRITIQNL